MFTHQTFTLLTALVLGCTSSLAMPTAQEAAPRTLHVTRRPQGFHDIVQGNGFNKRGATPSADGGMVFPLVTRTIDQFPDNLDNLMVRRGAQALSADAQDDAENAQGDGKSKPKPKPSPKPSPSSGGQGNKINLDLYHSLNVTVDGMPTELVVTGDELMVPGSKADPNFHAPKATDTGLKYKFMSNGGSVHKGALSFGGGKYNIKDVAYGTQEMKTNYVGYLGFGVPGKRIFPKGSPPSLTDAAAAQAKITSYSVAMLDEYTLFLNQKPFVDVDPKAKLGSVSPVGPSWFADATFNGTKITADFYSGNTHIYGDDAVVQKFFGNLKPTPRKDMEGLNFYSVPCDKPPVIGITIGDVSKKGSGITVNLSGEAAVFADKESSTGCTSVVVGQKPDPTAFRTSWTLGNEFTYHVTPSFNWDDPKKPVIEFYSRPDSLYPQ